MMFRKFFLEIATQILDTISRGLEKYKKYTNKIISLFTLIAVILQSKSSRKHYR